MKQMYMRGVDREQQILDAGLRLSREFSYLSVTRQQIADEIGSSRSLISVYFKSVKDLRIAIITEAIKQQDLIVIAQGIVARDSRALRAPEALRRKAMMRAI
jgi:AcrR family transcriptional regulator